MVIMERATRNPKEVIHASKRARGETKESLGRVKSPDRLQNSTTVGAGAIARVQVGKLKKRKMSGGIVAKPGSSDNLADEQRKRVRVRRENRENE